MFKRANKITALLVAAASVMSVVPAMAATKLANKDGHVYNAVAFDGGKYLYEGYRTDDDDSALYYNDGKADKKLDDATTFDVLSGTTLVDNNSKFDKKLSMVKDGSDNYVVDLSTGKISDEDAAGDLLSNATNKLETKLNKAKRYGKDAQSINLQKVDDGTFEDVWYEYTATASPAAATFNGYTNASGAYIDASHNINAYVYSAATHKMVKLENAGDQDTANGVSIGKNFTNIKTIAQDDKYFYRLATIDVQGVVDLQGATTLTVTLLQKISKAQGDQEGDAYLPKSTESYVVSTGYDNAGDCADGAAALALAYAGTNGTPARPVVTRVVDGAIYVTYKDGTKDKVKTVKVVLKNAEKLDANLATNKVDAHVVKKDGDKDHDAKWFSVDTKGTVWAINDGEILKSTKVGDFSTVYTCDRSMNRLDVYDENNLIAWQDGSDVYTTVGEGTAAAQAEAATIVQPTPAKIGWDKLADGSWNFYDATGAKQVNKWINAGGYWYFLKADGVMATGWYKDNGTWYYLNASGAMATGWFKDTDGNWYYLNASGAMLANTTVDGYKLGASGAWVK